MRRATHNDAGRKLHAYSFSQLARRYTDAAVSMMQQGRLNFSQAGTELSELQLQPVDQLSVGERQLERVIEHAIKKQPRG